MRSEPFRELFIILVIVGAIGWGIKPVTAGDSLEPSDFEEESWSISLDLLDFARDHAEEYGRDPPPDSWSSDLRLNYINLHGVRLLYAGFVGVTLDKFSLTVPLQAFIEHFKTRDGLDAITASSFLMMMAYNETDDTLFPNSPDKSDRLYASFNLGREMSEFFGEDTPSRLSSSVEVTHLTHSDDKLEWEWGMRYKDLTAIWWILDLEEGNPRYNHIPVAFSLYDELAFNYRLVFDPKKGVATMYLSYTIGEMRELWTFKRLVFLPQLVHYNSTGCYLWKKHQISDETIHDFIRKNDIGVSLVLFQRNIVIDRQTISTSEGENVADSSVDVSSNSITTTTENGEKVFEVAFGDKQRYWLHNSDDGSKSEHDAVTRTSEIEYYSKNPVIELQTSLLRFIPLVVRKMVPEYPEEDVENLLNVERVDYLYITSYPTFEGYRIVHDPLYKAYFEPPQVPDEPTVGRHTKFLSGLLIIVGVPIIFFLIRRK